MKRNAIAIATATLCALGLSSAAHAQVSGDTIKIGFISDMSGVYSDVDGLGGAEAIKMAIADAGVVLAGKRWNSFPPTIKTRPTLPLRRRANGSTSRASTC